MDAQDMSKVEVTKVAIIGAGVAGISMAIALRNDLHEHDFRMFERADGPGGTWRLTTYPGCGSDVPAHWYSLSTELNPDWTSYFVEQPELHAYWQRLFLKHRLDQHTEFSSTVELAKWDETRKVWTLTVRNQKTGAEKRVEALAVVHATGPFTTPNALVDVKGEESFKGEVWHSSKWRHDVDLAGKRVGVIGNGCSAAQLIPRIAADPSTHVTNFARTPQWCIPRLQFDYPAWAKWGFRYLPGMARVYRDFLMLRADLLGHLTFSYDNPAVMQRARKLVTEYMKQTAPEKYHEDLIPTFSVGCKRVIVDPDYLKCLHQPNVELTYKPIMSVTESGIDVKDGKSYPLDVIVYATGYAMLKMTAAVQGVGGLMLEDFWKNSGGPTAHNGTCVPDFPNIFFLTGPNTATGHASIIFTVEVQIEYVKQLMKPLLSGRAKTITVKPEACARYNDWLQQRLARSVWTECRSFYRTGGQGKNFSNFPGPLILFWWLARKVKWNEFEIEGGPKGGRWMDSRLPVNMKRAMAFAFVACLLRYGHRVKLFSRF